MRGDFSRLTFDPLKHFAGVLHQQGRVWLDSDWNEDVLNRLSLLQQETVDIIGVCGAPIDGVCDAPEANTAFRISPNPAPGHEPDDFLIAGGPERQGHYYVDGILCQLDAPASYLQQPDFPAPPRISMPATGQTLDAIVYLEVWRRLITYLEDETLRETALGGPDTAVRLKTVAQVKVQTLPAGVLSPPDTGDFTCLDAAQHLPPPQGGGRLTTLQTEEPSPPDLCHILDPQTYTGRENHLYRVEIHDGGDVLGAAVGGAFRLELATDAGMGAPSVTLAALSLAQAEAARRAGVVTLRDDQGQTETVPLADVTDATLSLGRGLSASYTTANHATVTGGVARFKWSRDNAAFAVRVTAIAADRRTLTLASLGRDQATALRAGDLVEVADDASELGPACGPLTFLTADPDPDAFTVTLAEALPPSFQIDLLDERHMLLRRWDGAGLASATFGATTTPEMNLGDGVHIQFGGERLLPGDFWMFTARSADGSVELLTDAPPLGIIRHRCPLALVRWSWATETEVPRLDFEVRSDCRAFFPALTDLLGLFYVSGDGQEATPDLTQPATLVPLPEPLCVGVANGRCPVANARVRFEVAKGNGQLKETPTSAPTKVIDVLTESHGIACVFWELDSTNVTQQVMVRLLDVAGNPIHLPVRFTANLSIATEVAYDPRDCPALAQAAVRTVQAALDRLCQLLPQAEPGIVIRQILSATDNRDLLNDVLVPVNRLLEGVLIICDAPLSPESGGGVPPDPPSNFPAAVPAKPTCFVTLDLPYPLLNVEQDFWDLRAGQIVGFQPLILGSTVSIQDNVMSWRPTGVTRAWLGNLFGRLSNIADRVLAHLTVKGNFIWRGGSDAEPTVYLDGDVFGRPSRDGRVDLRLPSGNGRRGGDFEMWFWLSPPDLRIDVTVTRTTVGNVIIRSIIGTVRDRLGSVIPGATVNLTGPTDTQPTVTDNQGNFAFPNVAPGSYVVTAQFRDLSAAAPVTVPGTPPPIFDPGNFPGRTLDEVRGLGPTFIARLEASGITHPAEVAALEPTALAEILRASESRARTIIAEARRLLTG
jgi:Family of unknown function (DUF6519)/Carboxypeptidase regulatory-like domain